MDDIKTGDMVRVTNLIMPRVWKVKVGDVFKVDSVDSDGDIYVKFKVTRWLLVEDEFEKVEEIKNVQTEMTFPEMAQKLIDGEFEVGTELFSSNRSGEHEVVKNEHGYGFNMGISLPSYINATWTVKEKEKVKEMSIEDIQKELGYKIKIIK